MMQHLGMWENLYACDLGSKFCSPHHAKPEIEKINIMVYMDYQINICIKFFFFNEVVSISCTCF